MVSGSAEIGASKRSLDEYARNGWLPVGVAPNANGSLAYITAPSHRLLRCACT